MKRLFICETPYQLIVSLCLKEQITQKNDHLDIIITNTFNGYLNVTKKLKDLKIFDNIYNVETICKNKLKKLKYVFNTKKFLKTNLKIANLKYDELYFWNYDSFNASIRGALHSVNKNLKTYIFEEGYNSYYPIKQITKKGFLMNLIDIKNKLIYNLSIENVNGIFLLNPELSISNSNYPIIKIDNKIITTKKFKNIIKTLFNVDSNILNKYDKKFIIFEEATYSNSSEFDDEKIIIDIVNKVGKENVLIKLHPRTTEDRFSKQGIKTLGSDGIPWEAISLFGDFSNKILIAISSSSISTYRMLFGKNMKGILLFKIVKPKLKYLDEKYDSFWNKIKSIYPEKGLYIPNNEKELNDLLNNLLAEDIKK